MYIHGNVHVLEYIQIHVYIYIYMSIYIYIYIHIFICIYIGIDLDVDIDIDIYIYTYIYNVSRDEVPPPTHERISPENGSMAMSSMNLSSDPNTTTK